MGLIDKWKGVRYRIRIFDHGLHVMSAEVPEKGQRYITVTIHKELFGFGDKVKLAFMVNRAIKPKIFEGMVMEVDFDVQDAVQLSDLLDICPGLVYDINENYKKIAADKNIKVIDADITVEPKSDLETVLDKIAAPADSQSIEAMPSTEAMPSSNEVKEPEEERRIDTVIHGVRTVTEIADTLLKLKTATDDDRKARVQKCLDLCAKHPKLLYWLPSHIEIEQEIHAIVSQSMIYQVGIMPSYYIAQTNAAISEKTLTRPREKEGWEGVVKIAIVLGLIVVCIIACVYFLTHRG